MAGENGGVQRIEAITTESLWGPTLDGSKVFTAIDSLWGPASPTLGPGTSRQIPERTLWSPTCPPRIDKGEALAGLATTVRGPADEQIYKCPEPDEALPAESMTEKGLILAISDDLRPHPVFIPPEPVSLSNPPTREELMADRIYWEILHGQEERKAQIEREKAMPKTPGEQWAATYYYHTVRKALQSEKDKGGNFSVRQILPSYCPWKPPRGMTYERAAQWPETIRQTVIQALHLSDDLSIYPIGNLIEAPYFLLGRRDTVITDSDGGIALKAQLLQRNLPRLIVHLPLGQRAYIDPLRDTFSVILMDDYRCKVSLTEPREYNPYLADIIFAALATKVPTVTRRKQETWDPTRGALPTYSVEHGRRARYPGYVPPKDFKALEVHEVVYASPDWERRLALVSELQTNPYQVFQPDEVNDVLTRAGLGSYFPLPGDMESYPLKAHQIISIIIAGLGKPESEFNIVTARDGLIVSLRAKINGEDWTLTTQPRGNTREGRIVTLQAQNRDQYTKNTLRDTFGITDQDGSIVRILKALSVLVKNSHYGNPKRDEQGLSDTEILENILKLIPLFLME